MSPKKPTSAACDPSTPSPKASAMKATTVANSMKAATARSSPTKATPAAATSAAPDSSTPAPKMSAKKPVIKQQGKYKSLRIQEKLRVLDCIEAGVKIKNITVEFGIDISTVYDIKNAKDKLLEFRWKQYNPEESTAKWKRVRDTKYQDLDEAVWKW